MENNTPSSESPAPQEPHHDRQVLRILRNVDLNLLTIFEAVYVHKGIVNAAKVLNITPSAISQSLNKLRAVFPDPLFIRKGQGVRPTAYATHLHQYISQGMESFLSALDLACGAAQPRADLPSHRGAGHPHDCARAQTAFPPDPVTQHRHYRCQQSA